MLLLPVSVAMDALAFCIGDIAGEHLRIESRFAEGGFAEVYLAHDCRTSRRFIVKATKRTAFENFKSRRGSRLSVYSEFITLCEMCHPHVVSVYDILVLPTHVVLCMEHLDGPTLLESATAMLCDEMYMVLVTADVFAALEYVHSLGISHRDVKPENVVPSCAALPITRAKLIDFGLACACTSEHGCKTKCGTFVYAAPEVRRGESYGYAVDMWALGVLVYACLSGEMPACSSWSNCPSVSLDGSTCLVDDCSCPHNLSRDAESFVLCLLRHAPSQRMTSTSARAHMWLHKCAPVYSP